MDKHKKLVRVLCLVLAGLMLITIMVPVIFAYAETPAEKLDRLKKELEEIKAGITATENKKEKSEQTKQYYLQQANNLKAQLTAIKEDIAAQQQRITEKNAEIAEKAASVAYNKSMFEKRLRSMYEMSRQSNIALILGVENLSDRLVFAENLQRISQRDTELVQTLRSEQQDLEGQRAELDAQLAELAAREEELTNTAVQYSQAIQQADASITKAEADLEAQQAAETETKEKYDQAMQEWIKWTQAENVEFEYNNEGFGWPLPGYSRLSSGFGWRTYWIHGRQVTDFHRGLDVPAPAGTPIYAAADGVVSTNNHWTYGTSVKISHGSGLATIYGHMSARVVNSGDTVKQGQLIGYVGATGNVSGVHLHFEVNLNGQPVDPAPYLPAKWG